MYWSLNFHFVLFHNVRPKYISVRYLIRNEPMLWHAHTTHVKRSKRSGCQGGRGSSQGRLLGLTPYSDVRSDILEKPQYNEFPHTVSRAHDWEISFHCINSAFTRTHSVTPRMWAKRPPKRLKGATDRSADITNLRNDS